MKLFSLILFSLIVFLSTTTFATELSSNELCGSSSRDANPCYYVNELNFHLDGNLYGKDSYQVFSRYLSNRVAEMDKMFLKFDVRAKFKPFSGGAWVRRPKEKDSNIELTFLIEETHDKQFITITFYTFSRGPFYIKTSQCPANEDPCVVEEMRNYIDAIVIPSIMQNVN